MEIQQIRYFKEVAETGNFTRAAERCHVTQPTLSHQLRKLEDELGEPLFLRRKPRARLTPFGEKFYSRALRILAEIKGIQDDALSFSAVLEGDIKVGAIPTLAPYLLPQLISGFSEKYASIRIRVYEEVTETLFHKLKTGELDFALISLPLPNHYDTCTTQPLFTDELLVTLPQDHALADAAHIDLSSLTSYPLVIMHEAHCLNHQVLTVCEHAGGHPLVSIRSSQLETLQAMVELGMGVSFSPAIALPYLSARKLVYKSIHPKKIYRTVALAWFADNNRTRVMTSFQKYATKHFAARSKE